jgi:hypothetical protein
MYCWDSCVCTYSIYIYEEAITYYTHILWWPRAISSRSDCCGQNSEDGKQWLVYSKSTVTSISSQASNHVSIHTSRPAHNLCPSEQRNFTAVFSYVKKALALFSSPNLPQISLCEKKISHHIKIPAYIWSTKCRWNQKLIAQFGCTLRDERFKPN